MAWRRASFASLVVLRSSADMRLLVAESIAESLASSLHCGQRLAKPGLSGLSSNSSLQMAQVLMGKGISGSKIYFNHGCGARVKICGRFWLFVTDCEESYSLAIISRTAAIRFLMPAILSGQLPPVGSG
jgi:hypothetical protein